MSNHTPGPWAATENSVRAPHDVHSFTTICQCIGGMKTGEEVRANARLIAAAPDLLSALQALLEYPGGQYSEGGDFDAAWDAAKAAAKKAVCAA